MTVQVVPGSLPVAPEPWETGYKDTVVALAGQVTRIRAQFNLAQAVFWCWRRRCWRTLAPVAEVDAAIHTVAGVVIMMDSEAGAGHYKECPHLAAYEWQKRGEHLS